MRCHSPRANIKMRHREEKTPERIPVITSGQYQCQSRWKVDESGSLVDNSFIDAFHDNLHFTAKQHLQSRGAVKSNKLSDHLKQHEQPFGSDQCRETKSVFTHSSDLTGMLSELLAASHGESKHDEEVDLPKAMPTFAMDPHQKFHSSKKLSDHFKAQEPHRKVAMTERSIYTRASDWTGLLSELLAESHNSADNSNDTVPESPPEKKLLEIALSKHSMLSTHEKKRGNKKSHRKKESTKIPKGRKKDRLARQIEFDQTFLGSDIHVILEADDDCRCQKW